MKLAVVGDEIGTFLIEQIESLKEANIKRIEIRKIDDKYLWEFTNKEIKEFKTLLDNEKIEVITLDSPVGKKPIPYERKKELFERYLEISKILNNRYIRIFSNLGIEIQEEDIKNNLKEYCSKAKDNGIQLIMENERATFAKSPVQCYELIKNENNIDILFDLENAFFEGYEIFDAYEKSKNRINYIHLRDFNVKTNEYAHLGMGDLEIEKFMKKLVDDNYNGIISVETHLPMNGWNKSKRELFIESFKNLKEIINKLNIEIG